MGVDLMVLVEAQNDIHGRMSRSVDNLRKMGAANITAEAVQARLHLLETLWNKFEANRDLIRTTVSQRSTLVGYANKYKVESPVALKTEAHPEHALKTSLPRIKLQTFSGAYGDWPAFRDIFLSIIGDNPSISNVEKLHYLRTSLQGPPHRNWTISGETAIRRTSSIPRRNPQAGRAPAVRNGASLRPGRSVWPTLSRLHAGV